MKFIATDGMVFTDRSLYKKYEMQTQYTFRDREFTTLTKMPGSIQGQPFDIINCKNCTILVLDNCEQVQIDDVSDSNIFIGASSGSIFVRNCQNCSLTMACKQLRTRDCQSCTLNLYCMTEPVIETSTDMRFAPFNGAYTGHYKAMIDAKLDPCINRWNAVYDFNDPPTAQKNWKIVPPNEAELLWCPLGEAECCVPSFGSLKHAIESPEKRRHYEDEDYAFNIYGDDDENEQPNTEAESSCKWRLFGHWIWGILSHSLCSVSSFCTALVSSGIQKYRTLLSLVNFH